MWSTEPMSSTEPEHAVDDRLDRPVSCSLCGATAGSPPLTWSASTGPRGTTWACDGCTRRHLRSMEARLDDEHW